MVDPQALVDQLRAIHAQRKALERTAVLGPVVEAVGAPPHLQPGERVRDPVSGQEGVVVAYGRGHVPGPLSPAESG